MASMNTRLNIEKLDGNIIQKHGGSKQIGLKQLGSKQVGFKKLGNRIPWMAQRRLEDKQPEEKTNTDCLVKEQENKHLDVKLGANITVTGVHGQEGAEGNVAVKNKFEVPALDEDAECRLCLSVTPKVEIVVYQE
uniref:Uncharacterized protein n=1 Tax=Tanacetum cinerariifolium TaxID=118510 RepID=A0A699HLP5_TANCI|nr:hypothetical protein [Tanacetum cinerariifolium]